MDPLSDQNLTSNNPRLDLLHSSGDVQQLAGKAGSYGPEPAYPATAAETAPEPAPAKPEPDKPNPEPPKEEEKKPEPAKSAPVPEPRLAPTPPPPAQRPPERRARTGILIGLSVVIILAAIGIGVYFWLSHRSNQPVATTPKPAVAVTPVTPTNLNQQVGTSTLSQGKATNKSSLTFTFTAQTSATSGSLTPEVEVEPVGTAFTGKPDYTGQPAAAHGGSLQFSVPADKLADGSYHWQARDSGGTQHSGWAVFGGDASALAFVIDTTAPGSPAVTTIGGVALANPTTVTSNQPPISGTAEPNSTVNIAISPDSQSLTATADSSGNWSVTPTASIPNGQHQLSVTATDAAGNVSTATQVALTINPATVAQTTPTPGSSGTPAKTTTPAGSSHLAETGDDTTAVSLTSAIMMILAATGLIWMRRRDAAL